MMYAAEYPETVKAAVMLHGLAHSSPEDMAEAGKRYPDLFERFMVFQQQMNESEASADEKNAKSKQFFLDEWFPYLFASRAVAEERLSKMFADVGFSWDHSVYANVEMQSFDARESLAKITAPCLVVAGARDMLPPEGAKTAADAIPNSTFLLFEHSGHFAPIEETELFIAKLTEFLSGIE
jgi:pimeloyl-ACP methyl ester carboxylesterase